MTDPVLHKGLEGISYLIGTWKGQGKGNYPTIDDFTYGEEVRFWHDGRPLVFYAQKTWNLDTEMPMHSETGFWRPQRDGSIEIVLAHTFGCVEIQEGRVDGDRIETRSKEIASTTSAKDVVGLSRRYTVDGDSLHYELQMAFGEHALQPHLAGRLAREE